MNLSPDLLRQIRAYYQPGTRVMLIRMNDPYATLKPGDIGTVDCVNDVGTVHVIWDCGSTLGVVFGEDECRKTSEKQL
jgi:hypothetical protein